MSELVIDANVWAMADRTLNDELAPEEADCIKACRSWLEQLAQGSDRLVVDWGYRILTEYRNNIRKNGFSATILNQLELNSVWRFFPVGLALDEDDAAVLPPGITFDDRDDRKYIAAALLCEPFAPIYNAADTDWAKERAQLESYGLTIHELCPELIALSLR